VRIVARWRGGCASVAEVAALRQLLPELRERPAADVFNESRATDHWVIATCRPAEARRVREQAERAGLVVEVESVPEERLRVVSDEDVVTGLTSGGMSVSDYILVWGMVCAVNARGELVGLSIDDDALAAATKAYLMRVGARSFANYEEFVQARPPGGA
jgi:hypothetical protein